MLAIPWQWERMCASPSSRRAWVEMRRTRSIITSPSVALLAEGVGRNGRSPGGLNATGGSPSSRRAWVEILLPPSRKRPWMCRPPRGGRG